MYLADTFYQHPKILKAAALLGADKQPTVLALYVAGLGYAHEHMTDGFIPAEFVKTLPGFKDVAKVISVLTDPSVRLWHVKTGGFQIHDYLDHNDPAVALKTRRQQKREQNRARQQAYRDRQKKGNGHT